MHGVGGPREEARMLGVASERDLQVVALGEGTRVARRRGPDDGVEGYTWGGLTSTSLTTGLWLIYLPFTLINAAGWAAPAPAPGSRDRAVPNLHGFLCRALALVATVGYVWWLGVILVDLVGWQWRRRLLELGAVEANGLLRGTVRYGMLAASWALFVVLVAGIFVLLRRRAPVEADPRPEPRRWSRETFTDPSFYDHHRQLGQWRAVHGTAAAGAVGAVATLAVLRRDQPVLRLGELVAVVAVVGAACLAGLWAVAASRRARPVGAAAATFGAVTAHAFFAGVGLLAVKHLSRFPDLPASAPPPAAVGVVGGPELGVATWWSASLAVGAVLAAAVAAWLYTRPVPLTDLPDPEPADPARPLGGLTGATARQVRTARRQARLAHKALTPGWVLALALAAGAAGYAVQVVRSWFDDGVTLAYAPGAWPEWIGGLLLMALPVMLAAGLRRAALSPESRRTLGTLWDVIVIWPARYHPLAIPPYAAQATAELTARIGAHLDRGPVLVSAHSQGTALAFVTLCRLVTLRPDDAGRLWLLTYGSHLNGLYHLAFPRHFHHGAFVALAGSLAGWQNFWRRSDPIGGPVFTDRPYTGDPLPGDEGGADAVCTDPAAEPPGDAFGVPLAAVPGPPATAPLERDRDPWVDLAGHSWYLAEPELKAWVHAVKTGALEAGGPRATAPG